MEVYNKSAPITAKVLSYAASLTPCSAMVRPDVTCSIPLERFSCEARQLLQWSCDLKSELLSHSRREGAPFNRAKLVEKLQSSLRDFDDIIGANTSYVATTLRTTIKKLQHYVAMRPSPYVMVWLPDFGHRIGALGALLACQQQGIQSPKELVENGFLVDARRGVLISNRDMLLFKLRGLFIDLSHARALSALEVRRQFTNVLTEITEQTEFATLPSSQWARIALMNLHSVPQNQDLTDVVKNFVDLFRYESRIVRNTVPSNIWGSKLDEIDEEHSLRQDVRPTEASRHLLWSHTTVDRGDDIKESLSAASNRVVLAHNFLFPGGLVPPTLCFESLTLKLKQEIIQLQLQSRQTAIGSNDTSPGLRNPDTTVADLDKLESRGYVTLISPVNQSVLAAFQVQYHPERYSENEKAILRLAIESTPDLTHRYPIFVRLTISDPRDYSERRALDIKPYEQLLDATIDRAMAQGQGRDPRDLFLFAIVRKGNPALELHLKRGWRCSGKTFTLVRDGKPNVEYDVIIHDPR